MRSLNGRKLRVLDGYGNLPIGSGLRATQKQVVFTV